MEQRESELTSEALEDIAANIKKTTDEAQKQTSIADKNMAEANRLSNAASRAFNSFDRNFAKQQSRFADTMDASQKSIADQIQKVSQTRGKGERSKSLKDLRGIEKQISMLDTSSTGDAENAQVLKDMLSELQSGFKSESRFMANNSIMEHIDDVAGIFGSVLGNSPAVGMLTKFVSGAVKDRLMARKSRAEAQVASLAESAVKLDADAKAKTAEIVGMGKELGEEVNKLVSAGGKSSSAELVNNSGGSADIAGASLERGEESTDDMLEYMKATEQNTFDTQTLLKKSLRGGEESRREDGVNQERMLDTLEDISENGKSGAELVKKDDETSGGGLIPVITARSIFKVLGKMVSVIGKGLKFTGIVGLVAGTATMLFDGFNAGIDEYNKSGNLTKAVSVGVDAFNDRFYRIVSFGKYDLKDAKRFEVRVTKNINELLDTVMASVSELFDPIVTTVTETFTRMKDFITEFISDKFDKLLKDLGITKIMDDVNDLAEAAKEKISEGVAYFKPDSGTENLAKARHMNEANALKANGEDVAKQKYDIPNYDREQHITAIDNSTETTQLIGGSSSSHNPDYSFGVMQRDALSHL